MKAKKLLAILTTIAMLVGMMGISAFAAEPIKEIGPTEQDKVEAAITKDVTTGKGVELDPTIAELTFKFLINQNKTASIPDGSPSKNENWPAATQDKPLGPVTIGPEYVLTNYDTDSAANDNYRKESASFLPTDFAANVTDEGIFVYDITEENSATVIDALVAAGWTQDASDLHKFTRETEEDVTIDGKAGKKTTTETFNMSKAAYQLRVYTKLKTDAEAGVAGNYYVSAITLVQTKTDTGEDIDNGPKKNPTPGGDETTYTMSQLEFKNSYNKVETTDINSPNNQPYEISKRVTGVDQDATILHGGQKFRFTVTMTLPEGAPKTQYKALYWDSDNGESFTALGSPQQETVFDFTSAEGYTVTQVIELEHDQKVTFPGVPAGTVFKTVEDDYFTDGITGENKDTNDQPITYHLKAVINGGTVPSDEEAASEAARTDTRTTVAGGSVASAYVNDGGEGTTPAGIIMQYLPFVVIIAIAVFALIASAVIKGKRRTAVR